jgi:hypothetical protein
VCHIISVLNSLIYYIVFDRRTFIEILFENDKGGRSWKEIDNLLQEN